MKTYREIFEKVDEYNSKEDAKAEHKIIFGASHAHKKGGQGYTSLAGAKKASKSKDFSDRQWVKIIKINNEDNPFFLSIGPPK